MYPLLFTRENIILQGPVDYLAQREATERKPLPFMEAKERQLQRVEILRVYPLLLIRENIILQVVVETQGEATERRLLPIMTAEERCPLQLQQVEMLRVYRLLFTVVAEMVHFVWVICLQMLEIEAQGVATETNLLYIMAAKERYYKHRLLYLIQALCIFPLLHIVAAGLVYMYVYLEWRVHY